MISFALSITAKIGRFSEALEWAKERAAWVSAQGCSKPVTLHVPVAGKEHTIVFVQGFDSLEEMHSFQKRVEANPEHRDSMNRAIRELVVEGSVESTVYEQID
jgi:diaminopimelate epimerase